MNNQKPSHQTYTTMKLTKKGNRYYMDNCWYLVPNEDGEFDVYDDGEWEGTYCGSLKTLEEMSTEEAFRYVLGAL